MMILNLWSEMYFTGIMLLTNHLDILNLSVGFSYSICWNQLVLMEFGDLMTINSYHFCLVPLS